MYFFSIITYSFNLVSTMKICSLDEKTVGRQGLYAVMKIMQLKNMQLDNIDCI